MNIEDLEIDDIYVNPYTTNAIYGEEDLKQFPTAIWCGTHKTTSRSLDRWFKKFYSRIKRILKKADGQTPVFMLYMMPNRDLGQYSKGGSKGFRNYKRFINLFIQALGDNQAIVLIESDSFPHLKKLVGTDLFDERVACLSYAIDQLSAKTDCLLYLDIGHPAWLKPEFVADLLTFLPREKLRGYCINVSNFVPVDICEQYAEHIWRYTHQPCIIDTSRNGGVYPVSHWCNPPEQRLGPKPQMIKSKSVDMYMWIKIPGESDGKQGGFPRAGKWSGDLVKLLKG